MREKAGGGKYLLQSADGVFKALIKMITNREENSGLGGGSSGFSAGGTGKTRRDQGHPFLNMRAEMGNGDECGVEGGPP